MISSILLLSLVSLAANMASAASFDTHFVELDSAKLIHTSEGHYGLSSLALPSNWKTVSVNGNELVAASKDNQIVNKKLSDLGADEKSSLESVKNQLMAVISAGPFHVKTQTGFAKLTTFDRHGGTSSMGTGGGSSSSSSSSSSTSSGGMSVSRTGPDAFIVSKDSFPFNWQRVFVNHDIDTVVYRDGRVTMLPESLFKSEEKTALVSLRQEVDKSSKDAQRITADLTSSLGNPFDFVNKALGGMFG